VAREIRPWTPTQKQATTLPEGQERLEREIAHRGIASRREAKALIVKGAVSVNGRMVTEPGFGIRPDIDVIEVDGANAQAPRESFLIYKPRGIETNKTSAGSRDLSDQFPALAHLNPIGRLDKETEGLIIMSNDGTLAKALTKVGSTVGKTYLVHVREQVTDTNLGRMAHGIMIDGIPTKPAQVERKSRTSFTIVLHEGRKHQIRRMSDACHMTIESLSRIAIGDIQAGKMTPGNVRRMTDDEISGLKK
jgi:23S rRNA pseudouridine2605 synthase